ncbi:hypothetical protein [Agrobacterium vitis]|uniref:hypothetical protein n=1 Tax=Agrobacterium vitis TaxID=373 RepID=UPI001573CDF6|nr:hypothetical protein [Agrobacterium vitis]NSY15065.1 hypothetical protein [Agrobacterium vitis]NSY24822.1 hypothetical protein [Agrobacterium vitis]NTA24353.1 hypothetical protein [Agrobacterium vitis]WEO74916.1 hypothetical protein G6L01_022985 [Agrobacterium vitis]
MQNLLTLEELVAAVLFEARDRLAWNSITLGEIQGRCLEAAEDLAPDLMGVLSSVAGLRLLIPALQAQATLIEPADEELEIWTSARETSSDIQNL